MSWLYIALLSSVFLPLYAISIQSIENVLCPNTTPVHSTSPCSANTFQCFNNWCIDRGMQCDGTKDCPDGSDEFGCPSNDAGFLEAQKHASRYLRTLRSDDKIHGKWGNQVSLVALALYFADNNFFSAGNSAGEEITLELTTELLAAHKGDQLSSYEIARYIHASLVSCIDNRVTSNLVATLRKRVDAETYSNPLALLALCNARDSMTKKDVMKLKELSRSPSHSSWTGIQALALMALTCISQKSNLLVETSFIRLVASELKGRQNPDGSIENFKTTALVAQALSTHGEESWDKIKAVEYLINSQSSDGSFRNLINTYYVLPLLKNKSLLDISSNHCRRNPEIYDVAALSHLENQTRATISVSYSLRIADRVVTRSLNVTALVNSTFFDVMNLAASIDAATYGFSFRYLKSKPYIYALSGIEEDPESDDFWFLHKVEKNTMEMINSSPIDVIPADKDHFVFWYKTGNWAINRPDGVLSETGNLGIKRQRSIILNAFH